MSENVMQEINAEIEPYKNAKTFSLKKIMIPVFAVLFLISATVISLSVSKTQDIGFLEQKDFDFIIKPIASTGYNRQNISIPNGIAKANPFLPYRNIGQETVKDLVDDVPRFDLIEPPESIVDGSEAARVMDTIVSGILYDKYSPSAILNIEGNDYLVKTGDVVNNYKVVAINQDSVTVKLGSNTYKAGIGEILTEGDVQHNTISNLNKKFGGERR